MKNKGFINIIITIIVIIVVILVYFFRYRNNTISNDVKNIKWYRYNNTSGYYETFFIDDNKFNYNSPDNNFESCNNYTYSKNNSTIELDCGEKIEIKQIKKDSIVLKINSKEEMFFKNINDSLNYEFKLYYNKSVSEYKKEKQQVLDFIEIKDSKLLEVIDNDEKSKIILIGSNCSSLECSLFLDVVEKWVVTDKNVYYYNVDNINDKVLTSLNKKIEDSNSSNESYNRIYPYIIISKEGKIIENYEIKCDGFNCSKYYNK